MQINEELNKKKIFATEIKPKQEIEIINEIKYINIYDSKYKKIQEEIKDKIIDKYLQIIISQQKEIDQLKKQLNDSIKSSIAILKISLNNKNINNDINNNILLSQKLQKQKLKNEILNINNISNKSNKHDIMVHILNRNQHKNLSYSTISSDNIKLKKNNTQVNGLTVEYKKNSKEKNNLSLSNSRIQLNKYEIISPKKIKIEKIKKRKNSKNKKERESTHTTINNIDINELNTYYLKEYNKKDNQKIEEIKTKLLNNNMPPPQLLKNEPTSQKNKNKNSIYKTYSQNKFTKVKNQNVVNKSNKYSYGKNNLTKIFNSPKSIRTQFNNINEKNKIFNDYYIKKNKISKNIYEENKVISDNNYLYTNPAYNTKNIIHKNININNNNNKIYINTDSNYLQNINNIKDINKHFKTQTNFYQHKIINRGDNQLALNYKDIMLTTPNDNHFDNQF